MTEESSNTVSTEPTETLKDVPMLQLISLTDVFYFLKRNVRLITASMLLSLVLAIAFVHAQTPLYTATSMIAIHVKPTSKMSDLDIAEPVVADDQAVNSELDVIRSRALTEKVIRDLNLVNDSEFNKTPTQTKNADQSSSPPEDSTAATVSDEIPYRVLALFQSRLHAVRKPKTYIIQVSFVSSSPQKAQKIANAIAENYIANQLGNKFKARDAANEWLSQKLVELQKSLSDSEHKVQEFRQQNRLTETAGVTVNQQQLIGLNSEVITARAELTQAQAKLANAHSSPDSTSEVLNSNLIQLLRLQQAEVLRKKADLSNRYGPKHPKMINVMAESEDIENKIQSEIAKIIRGLENQVIVAKARVAALEGTLQSSEGANSDNNRAAVQLAELVREMNANKALYEAFLARFKQTSEGSGADQADAHIVSYAGLPHNPSSPRKMLIYMAGLMLGALFAVLIATVIEVLDNTYRGLPALEHDTGLPVAGMLMEVAGHKPDPSDMKLYDEALKSAFISVSLLKGSAPKVIMVSSSIPEEGKTFFSYRFASMLAKSGKKVLLIDADFKRANLTKRVLKDASFTHGLNDITHEGVTLEDMIIRDIAPNLALLPCRPMTEHSQDLLNAPAMQEMIIHLRSVCDHIIIDTPPVMAVSDAIIVSKMSDVCMFLVRWGKTPRQVVKAVLKLLIPAGTTVSLAITRTNLKKLRGYGHGEVAYYYDKYKNY